jgi:hypothetical protein
LAVVLAAAARVNHSFESFIAALELEVDSPLFEVFKLVVTLNDQGFVATPRLLAGFNQQIEPLFGGVIGDAVIAAI